MKNLYKESVRIVLKAGKILEDKRLTDYKILRKEKMEFITEIDLYIQKYIIDELNKLSEFNFLNEEDRNHDYGHLKSNCFVIDPIDGTHNLISGLTNYSISVAYIDNYNVQFGIIYIPHYNILYRAMIGCGSYKNNVKINVSDNQDIKKGIVAYDNQFHLHPNILNNYSKLVKNVFTTRIFGSACIDACYVAEGIIDARIFNKTKLCDIAAGLIIINESNGKVTDFIGNDIKFDNLSSVIMSSGLIHEKLINLLKNQNGNNGQ